MTLICDYIPQKVYEYYVECYQDAVDKELGKNYLEIIYMNGEATTELLYYIAGKNNTDPMTPLIKYHTWQKDEHICECIRLYGENYNNLRNYLGDLFSV